MNLVTAERLLTGLHSKPGVNAAAPLAEAQALESITAIHGERTPDRAAAALAAARASLSRAGEQPDAAVRAARRAIRKAELEQADLDERVKDLPRLADALEADIAGWPV